MDDYFDTHDSDDLNDWETEQVFQDQAAERQAEAEAQAERDKAALNHRFVGREARVDDGTYYLSIGKIIRWDERTNTCDIETRKLVVDGKRRGHTPGLKIYGCPTDVVDVQIPRVTAESDPQLVMEYLVDTHGADLMAKLALSELHREEMVRDAGGQDNHITVAEQLCHTFEKTWNV